MKMPVNILEGKPAVLGKPITQYIQGRQRFFELKNVFFSPRYSQGKDYPGFVFCTFCSTRWSLLT